MCRRAFGVGTTTPLIVRGKAPILSWTPQRLLPASEDTQARLLDLYQHTDAKLAAALQERVRLARMGGTNATEDPMTEQAVLGMPAATRVRTYFADTAGAAVASSIDPYFFTETALPARIVALRLFYPLRYIYDPVAGVFRGNLTLANIGDTTFAGPFTILFPKLPPGVTVANPTGFDGQGRPFIRVSGPLPPKFTIRVPIARRNPLHVEMSTFFIGFPATVLLG